MSTKVEFSKRHDGSYAIWRLEDLFPENEMKEAVLLGWEREKLQRWNLIGVKHDRPTALAFCQSFRQRRHEDAR